MKKAGACDAPAELAMVELGLPGISALEVAHRLKERWPVTRVALMTGYGDRMNPDDAESRGVDLVLAKPSPSTTSAPGRSRPGECSGRTRLAAIAWPRRQLGP
jgi:DNA-binding NarL/FixJ family response regulator